MYYKKSRLLIHQFTLVLVLLFGLQMPQAPRSANLSTATPEFNLPKSKAKNLGISTTLSDLNPIELNAKLAGIKASGAVWVRFDLSWAAAQPVDGNHYDWAGYDAIVSAVTNNGLKPMAILGFTPTWARPDNCRTSIMCAPKDPALFANFAGQAARHYKSFGLDVWSIWNEPNIGYRYKPAPNTKQYVDLLTKSYIQIKQANKFALVVAGETAPSGTGNGNYSPTDFLNDLYANGAAGYFDVLAVHPYTYPQTPNSGNLYNAWGQMAVMHDIMTNYGDAQKMIWITEFGAPTNGLGRVTTTGELDYPLADHVSEDLQARILAEAIAVYKKSPWLGLLVWYDYQDKVGSKDSENYFGLRRIDGTNKPVFDVFQNAAAD